MAEYIAKDMINERMLEYAIISGLNYHKMNEFILNIPTANVIERSKIYKAKSNIEIMLEQEKQADGTYTEVGQGVAIALALLKNELGE